MKPTLLQSATIMLILLFAGAGCGDDTSDPGSTQWRMVWEDTFDGPAGQPPDSTKWDHDVGTDWGNAQLEYDTDRPENASLDGEGHLVIVAKKESYRGQPYTSARIVTRGLFERAYGRYEARIQLPYGQGLWPAFWLLGTNIETVGWPQCGEIDIMEYRGQQPSTLHGTLHGPGYSAAEGITQRYDLTNDRFDTGFHTFAVEWEQDEIRWYIDDVHYHTVAREDVPGEWVYDHPFYIILNVAVGGGWVGAPNASTTFPQRMLIDYVRVFEEVAS
ncbi:MAG: glycosyl hydrolase family 16 [Ignavibacteria bacterium]|nr:MAG: glycosyl hydrolase family 16 [Ignavibacteria bacterium]